MTIPLSAASRQSFVPSARKRCSALQKAGFSINFWAYFTRSLSRLVSCSGVILTSLLYIMRPFAVPPKGTANLPQYKGTPARYCARALPVTRTGRATRPLRVKNYFAAFAVSTSFAKEAASLIASSESILRFRSIPAFFRPAMKLE